MGLTSDIGTLSDGTPAVLDFGRDVHWMFAGPRGTGKTRFAREVINNLGEKYTKLPCGSLFKHTPLRC